MIVSMVFLVAFIFVCSGLCGFLVVTGILEPFGYGGEFVWGLGFFVVGIGCGVMAYEVWSFVSLLLDLKEVGVIS